MVWFQWSDFSFSDNNSSGWGEKWTSGSPLPPPIGPIHPNRLLPLCHCHLVPRRPRHQLQRRGSWKGGVVGQMDRDRPPGRRAIAPKTHSNLHLTSPHD